MSTGHNDGKAYYADRAKECGIPSYMIPGLTRYIVDRIPSGSFLMAVLQNDLMEALGRADDANINCLKAYGMFLYNHAPIGSYGSRENVAAWLQRHKSDDPKVQP